MTETDLVLIERDIFLWMGLDMDGNETETVNGVLELWTPRAKKLALRKTKSRSLAQKLSHTNLPRTQNTDELETRNKRLLFTSSKCV